MSRRPRLVRENTARFTKSFGPSLERWRRQKALDPMTMMTTSWTRLVCRPLQCGSRPDLVLRVSECITVGQPDIRAAATMAAFLLGHAVLDRTVVLQSKLDAATRQFEAASRNAMGRSKKAESCELQMDSLKRSRSNLEEIVMDSLIPGVFMHRYRDSNIFIRAESLNSLSK